MLYEDNYYLVHYGIVGQKWGLRRWQNEDGTLTEAGKEHYKVDSGGNKEFEKLFKKESKKLKKYQDDSNIDLQRVKAFKYKNRSVKVRKIGNKVGLAGVSVALGSDLIRAIKPKGRHSAEEIANASPFTKVKMRAINEMDTVKKQRKKDKWTSILETAGIVAAVTGFLGGHIVSGVLKVKSKIASNKTSEAGHKKAVLRARKQYEKMVKTFSNTPYISLFKDQIMEYKKEHPATELTDKEIVNNLLAISKQIN